MVYKVYSGRVLGVFGDLITVEVDSAPGLPEISIIGLPGSAVKEARERVKVALRNSGIDLPSLRLVINLSPADEHKEYTGLDLSIAIGILGVLGHLPDFDASSTLLLGELSLDGKMIPVRGVLPLVRMARAKGFKNVILPSDNVREGAMIEGIDIIPVNTLNEVIAYLSLPIESRSDFISPYKRADFYEKEEKSDLDFKDVYGQEAAKRAATIAAAGFHHLLLTGPPGTGKSLIAKRIPGIMPALTYEESLEVTTIYSIVGKLDKDFPFVKKRPFLSPHHGASSQAIVGGGPNAAPGLVSLSHKGILFLDEMAEFKKETLDMLRQPMEDGKITVSRARRSYEYPAGFMLVGAMNPCPCGYYPDRNKCNCSDLAIERYLSRLSGPILDRIDLVCDVARINLTDIEAEKAQGLDSEAMRALVDRAVSIQKDRYKSEKFSFNSEVPASKIDRYIPLDKECKNFLFNSYNTLNLSMRSYYKIIRVSRTIADLEGEPEVKVKHLAEAVCYRFPDYMRR